LFKSIIGIGCVDAAGSLLSVAAVAVAAVAAVAVDDTIKGSNDG
jgi:hypothetical protein